MLKLEKKQVKIVSLAIVLFFVLGIAGLAVSQTSSLKTANAGASTSIGYVNSDMLFYQHPDMKKADEAFQNEVQAAKQDFDAKSANMNDKEKQDYYNQLQERLGVKRTELYGPIRDKINAAIKAVADAKGLTVVLDKSSVLYGGQDITDEVIKKF